MNPTGMKCIFKHEVADNEEHVVPKAMQFRYAEVQQFLAVGSRLFSTAWSIELLHGVGLECRSHSAN